MSNAIYPGVPSDAYTIATPTSDHDVTFDRGIAQAARVGTAGDLEVVTYEGNTVILDAQPGDTIHLLFTQVKAANTTADQITIFR